MENNSSPNHSDYKPKYFNLLNEEDQEQYTRLRSTLSSHICRNRRGKRLETFAEMLNAIKTFCIKGDSDDWKRCLVCGVCWLSNGIAINTRQLGLLIDKCKSSINGSLQKMGYSTLQSRSESAGPLAEAIPELKNNFSELREWTVRLFLARTPQPNLPNYNVTTNFPFASPAPQRAQCYGYPSNPQEFPLYAGSQGLKNMSQPNLTNYSFLSPSPSMPIQHQNIQTNIPSIPQIPQMSSLHQLPINQVQPHIYQPTNPQFSQIGQPHQQMVSNGNYQYAPNVNSNYNMFNQNINNQSHPISNPNNDFNQPVTNNPTDQTNNNGNNNIDCLDSNNSDFFDDPFALPPHFLMSDDPNENGNQDPFDPGYTM